MQVTSEKHARRVAGDKKCFCCLLKKHLCILVKNFFHALQSFRGGWWGTLLACRSHVLNPLGDTPYIMLRGTCLNMLRQSQSLRHWLNDQTLFVKHLKFASPTKCLIVWPHHITLLIKHFLLNGKQEMFLNKQDLFVKQRLQNGQTVKNACKADLKLFDWQCLIVWSAT